MKKTNQNLKSICTIAMILSSIPAAKANEEGVGSHGGNAVVCFSNPKIAEQLTIPGMAVSKTIPDAYIPYVSSVQTLDLYEGLAGTQGEAAKDIVPMLAGETPEQYIERLNQRFKGWVVPYKKITLAGALNDTSENLNVADSGYLGRIISQGKKAIFGIAHITDPSLIPAQDIDPLTQAREGCVYTTMAKQRSVGYTNQKQLVIDDRLFLHPTHSQISKAALLTHEYVLAFLGPKNGTTEAVHTVTANFVAQKINYEQFAAFTNYMTPQTSIPEAASEALWLAGRIQALLKTNLDLTGYYAAILAFEREHEKEIPFTLRNRASYHEERPNNTQYHTDIFNCQKMRANVGHVSNRVCNHMNRLDQERTEILKQVQKSAVEKFTAQKKPEWNKALSKAIEGVQNLKITEELKSSTVQKIQALNPFDLSKTITDEMLEVPASQIVFTE